MLIVYGVYHFRPKLVAFRNDYCMTCNTARRTVRIRSFDVGHIFWIPVLPGGFWKRWLCTVCNQDPHVRPGTRRSFKWAGLFILILFSAVSWMMPTDAGSGDPDSVIVSWVVRICGPLGAVFTLRHLLRTNKDASLKELLATIQPASDAVCPFCAAQLIPGPKWICPACGVARE